MPLTHWERDMNNKADLKQLVFIGGQVIHKPAPPTKPPTEDPNVCTCPFCLNQGSPHLFAVSLKHGFSARIGRCPQCKNDALLTTLHRRWKIREFAAFVYRYSFNGYWQKCKFNLLNARLKLIGQQDAFWEEYRRLKGDNYNEVDARET